MIRIANMRFSQINRLFMANCRNLCSLVFEKERVLSRMLTTGHISNTLIKNNFCARKNYSQPPIPKQVDPDLQSALEKLQIADSDSKKLPKWHDSAAWKMLREKYDNSITKMIALQNYVSGVLFPANQFKKDFGRFLEEDNHDWYRKNYQKNSHYTNLLRAASSCSGLIPLPDVSEVTVIQLEEEMSNVEIAKKCLYIREFYPDLLAELRKYKRTVLIGNPGTGISTFFYYYLVRISNIVKFGDLPPDCKGQTDPPEVVIYQEGMLAMFVFYVKLNIVHKLPVTEDLLLSFDPKSSIYIYEPLTELIEPFFSKHKLPTLMLVSLNTSRYHEFCKHGGIKVFMPCFSEEELLAIGKHMREQPDFPAELQDLYTDDELKKRFHDFGGIIRHVCPSTRQELVGTYADQSKAITKCDVNALFTAHSLEDGSTSLYIARYVVATSGQDAFLSQTTSLQIISDDVLVKLNSRISNIPFSQLLAIMRAHNSNIGGSQL